LAKRPSDGAAPRPAGFGAVLRAHRNRGLLSQEQLAGRSGVSARAIRDLERGIRRPRGESVRLLADALGLVKWERERFEAAARSLPPAEQPPGQPVLHWPGPAVPRQLPPDIADFVGRASLMSEF
jgi:transcriptional regulator with XRE-family HTH domain